MPAEPHRFYSDLARWWPLISPASDYEEEAAFAATVLARATIPVRDVLELGSGGGHNALHLSRSFAMTLVDLSEEMLAVSRRLNPGCEHHRGDMRSVRLDRDFDAVFVHDAVGYMLTEDDLLAAMETAFAHCRPGGVAVFVPDDTTETYQPGADHGGGDGEDGHGVRFLEWSHPADPAGWVDTEYVFVVREAGGAVAVVHETHRNGLFGRDTWRRLLAEAGFDPVEAVPEQTGEARPPREFFVGHRPRPT